ncbi:RimJ/RimL family protein N-acetyltransferase [Candidatus Fermentibacteria bacterium]|nr:MAG: RimJ/RimL family protein N-acetyltransferase [Candidatus Fermentibacteria bacterium]
MQEQSQNITLQAFSGYIRVCALTMEEDDLELIAPEHAGDLFTLIQQEKKYLRRWLPWVDEVTAVDDTRGFAEQAAERYTLGKGPTYLLRSSGKAAGVAGFHSVDWPNRSAELGYWLGSRYTGCGLVTEACRVLLEYGFSEMRLNRIGIRCAKGNLASRAVAERLGMVFEGFLREAELLNDKYVDDAVYSMLRREYMGMNRER